MEDVLQQLREGVSDGLSGTLGGLLPFSLPGEVLSAPVLVGYDPTLIMVSVLVAVFAAYTALGMSVPIATCETRTACAGWLVAGAVALGGGVWAMHFIGMLAWRVPVGIGYEAGLTLFSILPAMLAGGVALYIVSKMHRRSRWVLVVGGALLGAGIGTMHYSGMAAMRLDGAVMRYDPVYFLGSIGLAVALACIALFTHHGAFHRALAGRGRIRFLAALVMGTAISAMHYTAMAGVSVHKTGTTLSGDALAAPPTLLALAAVLVTGLIMVLAGVAVVVDRTLRTIRKGRDQFESLVRLSPDMICTVQGGVITFVNPAGVNMLGVKREDFLIGQKLGDFVHKDYAGIFNDPDMLDELISTGDILPVMMHTIQGRPLETNMVASRIGKPEDGVFFFEFHDLTQQKKSSVELLNREQRINAIMDNAADGIVTMNDTGNVETLNAAALKMFRLAPADVVGKPFCDLMEDDCNDISPGHHEIMAHRSDDFIFPIAISVSDVIIGGERKLIAIFRDITNHRQTKEQMTHLANHDLVTDLPNRLALQAYLNKVSRENASGTVLFVALDKHKRINDSLGHDCGEKLLRMAGQRIQQAIEDCGLIGFWSAGEYIAIVPDMTRHQEVERLSALILDEIAKPFYIEEYEINITADIGASFYPEDANSLYRLVKNAGQAMFAGRVEGSWPCHYFSAKMAAAADERHRIESALRRAVERDEFRVFYQPKIELKTGRVGGMEALVRWESPEMGMVSPVQFIPLAEETGLIVPIGAFVLETACRDTRAWHDMGFEGLRVAVNLSGRQFEDAGLQGFIAKTIANTGLDPEKLELEVTESALMRDVEEGLRILEDLRNTGVTVAIDDFGTGYSSLGYLKQLPVDTLKIDQSFVRHIHTDAGDAAIAQTIVGMAQNLKLKVVAEGIETIEHEGFLKDLSCDLGQGYYYAKPMPRDDFTDFLRRRAPSAAE